MVIAKKDDIIFVTLADGEFLPMKFNSERVIVFRQGDSTNRELKVVKELGALAEPELLRSSEELLCNYSGDGNPLHEHADGAWWFFEETWVYEQGPFEDYDTGWAELEKYCIEVQRIKDLTPEPVIDTIPVEVKDDVPDQTAPAPNSD